MSAVFAETHIRALQLAKDCVEMGARMRTVSRITGLSIKTLRSIFYLDSASASGRWPESSDWYHRNTLVVKAEASVFAVILATLLVEHRCKPAEAFVCAYRLYLERFPLKPCLPFERAFTLACELHGIWEGGPPKLTLHTCRVCRSRYVVAVGGSVCGLLRLRLLQATKTISTRTSSPGPFRCTGSPDW
ncbi:FlhC family transcriptional regulator [Pseudoduganella sp. UC29_106]|uniref:FlhC family transcriptional regulator n=1 Tax=Pseudoduganella sp. UC29_106 TaxID=3374553 RepID=UPI003757E191